MSIKKIIETITITAAIATIWMAVYTYKDKAVVNVKIENKEIRNGEDIYLYFLCPYIKNVRKYMLSFNFNIHNESKRSANDFYFYLQSTNVRIDSLNKSCLMLRLLDNKNIWNDISSDNSWQDLRLNITKVEPHAEITIPIAFNTIRKDCSICSQCELFDSIHITMKKGFDNDDGISSNLFVLPLLVNDEMIVDEIKETIKKRHKKKGMVFVISTSVQQKYTSDKIPVAYCEIKDIENL